MILVKDGGQTLQGLCDKYGGCCSGILRGGKRLGSLWSPAGASGTVQAGPGWGSADGE